MNNICLVGIGLHCKRIYVGYCRKYKIKPSLIIELESFKPTLEKYLKEFNWEDIPVYYISNGIRDNRILPYFTARNLSNLVKKLNITNAIISTEPKGHFMWCKFFMENDIDVLVDKPITVYKDMLSMKSINQLSKDYNTLLKIQKKHNVQCKVMCQRIYHLGYMYVRDLIEETIRKYNIPITYLSLYHCDGKWNMPHEYEALESHPYKYGYGKMFHSGYHFMDLASTLLSLNRFADDSKQMTSMDMLATFRTPSDELASMNVSDYKKLFGDLPDFYNKPFDFENNGERDCSINIECKNKNNKVITLVNMNLLQSGFSRRSWLQSKEDTYKGNGRIRHESMIIQLGPLMSIHIHSYQAKEVAERSFDEYDAGGLEHFDIDIYRNVGMIGGKPFERVKLHTLFKKKIKHFIGFNEYAREEGITHFLNNDTDTGELKYHMLAMNMVQHYCMLLRNYYRNKPQQIRFKAGVYDEERISKL